MDTYALGHAVGSVVLAAAIAAMLITAIVKVVRYNIIRKHDGEEAARAFWNRRKNRNKNKRGA